MIPNALRGAIPAKLTIDEPGVSLTDCGLALETARFALAIGRRPTRLRRLRRWCVALFGSAAVASLAGGLDHGFSRRGGRERGHEVLWTTTLLAIGASSLALTAIAAEIGMSGPARIRVLTVATVATSAYALVIIKSRRDFLMAMLAYAPATLVLFAVLVRRYLAQRDRASLHGVAAVLLTFVAATVQRMEIGIPRIGIDHNTHYHLIQAVSFALLFVAASDLLDSEPGPEVS